MPGVLRTGMGSPVRSASLMLDEPDVTIPSTGINSPGLTTITISTSTDSAGILTSWSPCQICAARGARSASADNDVRARRRAKASSASPPESMSTMKAPARYSFKRRAPVITSIAIKSTLNSLCMICFKVSQSSGMPPITTITRSVQLASSARPTSHSTRLNSKSTNEASGIG